MTKAKTVKVRIAVAVDAKGRWNAYGWFGQNEKHMLLDVLHTDDLSAARHAVTIEAIVPLPPPPKVVKGKVAKGANR